MFAAENIRDTMSAVIAIETGTPILLGFGNQAEAIRYARKHYVDGVVEPVDSGADGLVCVVRRPQGWWGAMGVAARVFLLNQISHDLEQSVMIERSNAKLSQTVEQLQRQLSTVAKARAEAASGSAGAVPVMLTAEVARFDRSSLRRVGLE